MIWVFLFAAPEVENWAGHFKVSHFWVLVKDHKMAHVGNIMIETQWNSMVYKLRIQLWSAINVDSGWTMTVTGATLPYIGNGVGDLQNLCSIVVMVQAGCTTDPSWCTIWTNSGVTWGASNWGENDPIVCFGKIYGKLVLIWKYLIIYHFFNTQILQNRVLNSIWI